ncbi:MAG TPA: carboxypeptidase-like regulatory domain-containing protein [Pyrinomonadaceae bacterium]
MYEMKVPTLLLLFLASAFYQKNTCTCIKPAAEEATYWSSGEVTMNDDKVYKTVHGVIQYPDGKPMPDALVEIYNKPENVLRSWKGLKQKPIRQKRIAACKTGTDGKFCFTNIPSGKYELRTSKSSEMCCAWNPVRAYLVLDPRKRNSTSEGLEIALQLSH